MADKSAGATDACTIKALSHAIRAAPRPSPEALRRAKLLLLDALGCGLLGAREDTAKAVARTARFGGAFLALGRRERVSLLDAVLMNGVAIRALDFNDYLVSMVEGEPESGGHPSDNIPVALAVGTAYGRSGTDILAAIALGYELYARLQAMIDRSGPWDGVCVTGIVAPAMAGLLIGLDETEFAHALALGLSRAAMPALVRREKLSAAKTIANALIAQSGVQAALFAAAGITGPLAILDSPYGLSGLFARYDKARLADALPSDGAIMRARIKAYPCVNTAQGIVAAALALRGGMTGSPAGLVQIALTMPDYRSIARQQNDPSRRRPESREAADHSFPFLTAIALIDGELGLAQYEAERWRDPAILSLMDKIEMRLSPELSGQPHHPFPCIIEAASADGAHYRSQDPEAAAEVSETTVASKFHAILKSVLPHAIRDAIVDAVMELDRAPSTAQLEAALAKGESVP